MTKERREREREIILLKFALKILHSKLFIKYAKRD